LFLACKHLNLGTNLRECEDQSWFKVQAVPAFRFEYLRCFRVPRGYAYSRLKTTALFNDDRVDAGITGLPSSWGGGVINMGTWPSMFGGVSGDTGIYGNGSCATLTSE
jgi:hypothetical protein